jgi:isocitrate/isopropylmalate dehydrogenase
VGALHGLDIQYKEFQYHPKTYWELKDSPAIKADVEKREISDIVAFCREAYSEGFQTIFQTATNAGTLYQQRMLTEMMKVMRIRTENGDILIAREQSQGFYAIDSKEESDDRIALACSYSREKLYRTLDAALKEADEAFGEEGYSVRIVYKYHLFDRFNQWIKGYIRERGLGGRDISVVQPDTGYDYLMRTFLRGCKKETKENVLCVVSNEIGDIFTEALPNHYGVGDKATMYAINISLEPRTLGQVVYQTIHGSADDIAGQERLNPFATLRAAADILETRGGLTGITALFEEALDEAAARGQVTPDLGGERTTTEVVDFVLGYIRGDREKRVR